MTAIDVETFVPTSIATGYPDPICLDVMDGCTVFVDWQDKNGSQISRSAFLSAGPRGSAWVDGA